MMDLQESIEKMKKHTDMFPWYWLSYGEKCYAFQTVEAFPLRETDEFPDAGTQLLEDGEIDWVGENGVKMIINDTIANIESQNGDVICEFIALAHNSLLIKNELTKKDTEIARLEEKNNKLHNTNAVLQKNLEAREDEVACYIEVLEWYGRHDDSCSFHHGKKCDCGFAEALKGGE